MSQEKITTVSLSPSPHYGSYSGFIIIRLKPEYTYKEGASFEIFERLNNINLLSLVETKPCSISRLVNNISIQELKAIEDIAKKSNFPPLRSLSLYWRLDYRSSFNDKNFKGVKEIIDNLEMVKAIDIAYGELLTYDSSSDYYNMQDYLRSSNEGMNVEWVWEQEIKGEYVGLIDLEQGWELSHQGLPNLSNCQDIIVNHNACGVTYYKRNNELVTYEGNHGTGVLGIILAKAKAKDDDDNIRIKGIAPNTAYVKLASHYNRLVNANGRIVEAILGIISKLFCGTVKSGDILLIECQKPYNDYLLPVEIEVANFDAIRLASALGFIVIESAGNGGHNLEDSSFSFPEGDSGAIMVGGASPRPTTPKGSEFSHFEKHEISNFGCRIDCFAPIEKLTSPTNTSMVSIGGKGNDAGDSSDDDENPANNYQNFGGTSLASAIIAGAAILVQSAYKQNKKSYLSPSQMRYLLKKGGIEAEGIGVMPNLEKVIEAFSTMPDVYIQTHKNYRDIVPKTVRKIYNGKDIIIKDVRIPIDRRSDDSTWESTITPDTGNTHYIYLKIKSKGGVGVENIKADIYFRKANKYVTFDNWELIPSLESITIPERTPVQQPATGNSADINDPFIVQEVEWNLSTLGSGTYYLMVVLRQSECDGLTFPIIRNGQLSRIEDILDSEQIFEQFVRNNNNVACLKFTIPDRT